MIDLTRPQRRLLKTAQQVEPRAVTLSPGELPDAEELDRLGLGKLTKTFGGRFRGIEITAAGRDHLR